MQVTPLKARESIAALEIAAVEESQKVPLYVLWFACGFLHFTNFQKPSIQIPKELRRIDRYVENLKRHR